MTEELKNYLESSKESRKRLSKLAENTQSSRLQILSKVEEVSNDFPSLNPKRFKNYEQVIHEELKSFFKDDKNGLKEHRKGKSFASRDKKISSAYKLLNVRVKKMSFLPPINREKERSVPERLLGGKYITSIVESAPSIDSVTNSTKRTRMNRFEVKKLLFEPILKQKYEDCNGKYRDDGV